MPAAHENARDRVKRSITGAWFGVFCASLAALIGCNQSGTGTGGGWTMPAMFAQHKQEADGSGEQWTILCVEAHGSSHQKNCEALADGLRRVDQLSSDKVRVFHEPTVSRVYYGAYQRTLDDPGRGEHFGPEILRDLQLIRSLANGESYPFASARVIPKPTPDPGLPEWEVSKCPGKLTLQIGVFYNTATFSRRKEAAAEWAKQLRDEGIEAYYHHGEARSSVTVGHFGDQDVIREQVGPKFASANTVVRYGDKVEAMRTQERFQYNLENGHKVKRIRNTPEGPREVYQKSFLIHVPKRHESPRDYRDY
ncbi:MAG: hypothetical protein JXQ73_25055 [Phycisphaerae bacterium]|nr:hypothetical protein [Phycisphaerae bacterium]